jgi:hypothetical protein
MPVLNLDEMEGSGLDSLRSWFKASGDLGYRYGYPVFDAIFRLLTQCSSISICETAVGFGAHVRGRAIYSF